MAMKLYGKYWTLKISMLFVEPKCLSGEKSSTLFFRFPIESILRERERFDDKEKIGNDGKGQENTFQSMNFNKQASTQKEHPISLCRPRACHGNYPPACHTKLTLILPLEKSNSLFFRSSALSSESRVCAAQWIANAHLQSSSISIGFPLLFFHQPFVSTIRRTTLTLSASPGETLVSTFDYCHDVYMWRGSHAAPSISFWNRFECGRPCKITFQWAGQK